MNRHARGGTISTGHTPLTSTWTADVATVETAVEQFTAHRLANDCRVMFFEIVNDRKLHVNVTHKHPTKTPSGWAGPAKLPQGFVHNRTFNDTPTSDMIRHIRAMVFAARM